MPAFVTALMGKGLISDDLLVAEISATGGPTYALEDMSLADIEALCDHLDGAGVQWVIDRAGQLVVHRNDERRTDSVFEEVFGPDDDPETADNVAVRTEVEDMAARMAMTVSEEPRSLRGVLFLAAVLLLAVVIAVVLL